MDGLEGNKGVRILCKFYDSVNMGHTKGVYIGEEIYYGFAEEVSNW